MNRYFRLKKQIPGTVKMTDLVMLDDKDWVYKTDRELKNNWLVLDLKKEDLEMTEYFEESIGMSADKYVLFKSDEVFINRIQDKIYQHKIQDGHILLFDKVYYKKENVPVVKTPPKTWEKLEFVSGYYIDDTSKIIKENKKITHGVHKNIFKTEKQALSSIAFAQLSQLVAEMNDGWIPIFDSGNYQDKYFIERLNDKLHKKSTRILFVPLCFKTKELRDFSFEFHKQLWEQLYQL